MLTQSKQKLRQTKTYKLTMIALLACLCVISTIVCVAVGSVDYTVGQVIDAFRSEEAEARLIIWNVRLPRILCGGIVGICLSLAGCILQGVMRNHMASPSTIGVTSGASFVGYMMLVVFPQYYHMLPIGAILGSFATTMAIYVLAYDRGVSPVKMILSGMAVSAVFGAFNDMIKIFFAERLADATGFMVGSLNGVSWADFKLVLPYVAIGVFVCLFLPSIVNMGLAKLVDAPVLLVGDIDRGGVFAQLYGTVALLEEDERARIKGTVVNKFRGDKKILEPGIKILEDLCGVPVAGVIPYTYVDVDDEDSLSERFNRSNERKLLDIAVIRLPRISNFTDFSPFERYENVSLRYVEKVADLHKPDMILIPGTKSTISDLKWLRQSGLEAAVLKAAASGTLVFGVCGGYQMLGRTVSDPDQVEAAGVTKIAGMDLLPMDTVFYGEKVQTQTSGTFVNIEGMLSALNGISYEGYEIHMGRSEESLNPVIGNGNVYGSYIHGIFDAPGVTDTILQALCQQKGIDFASLGTFDMKAYKEQQYDKLADAVREGLDMELVYKILNREV